MGQGIEIRAVDFDLDSQMICEIMGEFDPEPLTAESLVMRWRDKDQAIDPLRLVALVEGELAGYLNCRRWPHMPEGRAFIDTGVAKRFQRRGIGTSLFQLGFEHFCATGWTMAYSRARETDDRGPEMFLKGFGFETAFVHFESVMDTTDLSVDFSELLDRARGEGYEFVSWEEFGDTDAHRRQLHAMVVDADKDEPGHADFGSISFEAFCLDNFDEGDFRADAMFLALKEGNIVGVHNVFENESGDTDGGVGYTGVARGHRGWGLAKALKWLGVEKSRQLGLRTLITQNDSRNTPMLAINDQYGFVRRPGWVHMKKVIGE